SLQSSMRFARRTIFFGLFLLTVAAGYLIADDRYKKFSDNNYVNELAGNGLYEFGTAFWNNSIDYDQFYVRRNEQLNFAQLRRMLQAPNATFTGDSLS